MLWVSAFFSIELLAWLQGVEAIDGNLDSTSLNELHSISLVTTNRMGRSLRPGSDRR